MLSPGPSPKYGKETHHSSMVCAGMGPTNVARAAQLELPCHQQVMCPSEAHLLAATKEEIRRRLFERQLGSGEGGAAPTQFSCSMGREREDGGREIRSMRQLSPFSIGVQRSPGWSWSQGAQRVLLFA